MLQIILLHMFPRKCGNSRLCIAMYTIVLITKRNNRNTIECRPVCREPKNRQFNPFYFLSIHNSKQMKMARSQCNCFAGLELKRCHMPRTRDRKVGMKEIQQWLIRKSYESETYPLSSVHQETNQTNFLLENLRNFLLENLRSFLLENLRLSVHPKSSRLETHCSGQLKTAKTNCERISTIGRELRAQAASY